MPITIKTKTVFHCRCIYTDCLKEWDAEVKPARCAGCKRRQWNGEDHRFRIDMRAYKDVPVESQIATGTKVPRAPSLDAMLDTFLKAKASFEEIVRNNPCDHRKTDQCFCPEKKLIIEIDMHIERLRGLQPKRSTYLVKE